MGEWEKEEGGREREGWKVHDACAGELLPAIADADDEGANALLNTLSVSQRLLLHL